MYMNLVDNKTLFNLFTVLFFEREKDDTFCVLFTSGFRRHIELLHNNRKN